MAGSFHVAIDRWCFNSLFLPVLRARMGSGELPRGKCTEGLHKTQQLAGDSYFRRGKAWIQSTPFGNITCEAETEGTLLEHAKPSPSLAL